MIDENTTIKFQIARFVESVKELWSFKFYKQAIEKYKNWDGKYKVEEIPLNVIIEDKCNRKLTLSYEVEDEYGIR